MHAAETSVILQRIWSGISFLQNLFFVCAVSLLKLTSWFSRNQSPGNGCIGSGPERQYVNFLRDYIQIELNKDKSTAQKLPVSDYLISYAFHSVGSGIVQAWDDNYEQQLVEYDAC